MSDRQRYPWPEAMEVANALRDELDPFCQQIVVAGSLRRHKPTVGDIELLYLSRLHRRMVDLLTSEEYNFVEDRIELMLDRGVLAKRPNVTGTFTWGPKNKLAIHVASGIPVDLFATTAANWAVSLVVRTGGKEMNLALTTGAQRLGRSLMAYGNGVRCSDGSIIVCDTERAVFDACGVAYREPEDRA